MYLFVFVVLISSILGLYTQLYMLQTSKMMAKQSGIAGIMLDWHGGAYNHAKTNNITSDTTGCLLTSTASPYTALPNWNGTPCSPPFDNGTPNHKWYTIVYLPPPGTGTQNYMVTFARPPASGASDPIAQPAVGYVVAEIWNQIKKSGAPKTNYGRVQVNSGGGYVEFITPDGPIDTDTNRPHTYRLPTCARVNQNNTCIPLGTVGFITPL